MKYMGSKNRIAKFILPIILKNRKQRQYYVEPFVGGGNMIDKVDGLRIGADINPYLVSLFKALQSGWKPPHPLTEKKYYEIKNNPELFEDYLVAYAGFQLSYGAVWFSTYRRDNTGKRDYSREAYRNVLKQSGKLSGVEFYNCNYWELNIPENSIIYCDPPYKNTTGYGVDFDHEAFWQWCRNMTNAGHEVFVSEYGAPEDFVCIWEKEICSSLTKDTGGKKGVEKLFRYPPVWLRS